MNNAFITKSIETGKTNNTTLNQFDETGNDRLENPFYRGSVAERSKVSNSGPTVVSSNPALGHQC